MTAAKDSPEGTERQEPTIAHPYRRTDHTDVDNAPEAEDSEPENMLSEDEADETIVVEPIETQETGNVTEAEQDDSESTHPDPNQVELTLEASDPPETKKTETKRSLHRSKPKKKGGFKKFCLFLLILSGILSCIIAGLYFYFSHTNQFPIKTVKVVGEYQYVKEADIVTTLKPFILDKGLFAFSEWKAEAALEKIPGVADASIWRIPPDKIKVVIRERSAVARFTDGALLSSKGVVFTTSNTKGAGDLPLLNGNHKYGKDMLTMLESLEPIFNTINAKVTGLGLSENGDWSVQLDNQTWIMLGKSDLTDRVQDFLTAYPVLMKSATTGATLSYVDLRYSHGFAASWTGGTSSNS